MLVIVDSIVTADTLKAPGNVSTYYAVDPAGPYIGHETGQQKFAARPDYKIQSEGQTRGACFDRRWGAKRQSLELQQRRETGVTPEEERRYDFNGEEEDGGEAGSAEGCFWHVGNEVGAA